jgi:hypothetical protein
MRFNTKSKKIRSSDIDNLSIGLEYDTNPDKPYPMFLYTPSISELNNHFHIALSRKQAKILRDWLSEYLRDN